jgi:hypothetical protein
MIDKIQELQKRIKFILERKKEWVLYRDYEDNQLFQRDKNPLIFGQAEIIVNDAYNLFPKEKPIFDNLVPSIKRGYGSQDYNSLVIFLDYLLGLIANVIELEENKYNKEKVFHTAKERINLASKSFRDENYPAVMANIHTALEIGLKNKLNVPPTFEGIRVGPLIGMCIRNKIFPELELFLTEMDKKAAKIDNFSKHQSYVPSKQEALEAYSVAEQFIDKLEKTEPILPKDFYPQLTGSISFMPLKEDKE